MSLRSPSILSNYTQALIIDDKQVVLQIWSGIGKGFNIKHFPIFQMPSYKQQLPPDPPFMESRRLKGSEVKGNTVRGKTWALVNIFYGECGARLHHGGDIDEVSEGETHKAAKNIHCRSSLYCIARWREQPLYSVKFECIQQQPGGRSPILDAWAKLQSFCNPPFCVKNIIITCNTSFCLIHTVHLLGKIQYVLVRQAAV